MLGAEFNDRRLWAAAQAAGSLSASREARDASRCSALMKTHDAAPTRYTHPFTQNTVLHPYVCPIHGVSNRPSDAPTPPMQFIAPATVPAWRSPTSTETVQMSGTTKSWNAHARQTMPTT